MSPQQFESVCRRIVQTEQSYTLAVLRVALAIVIFPHGAQKLLGWFGGPGVDGTMQLFATLGVPAAIAVLVIVSDFFGSLALAIGLLGRVAAFGTTRSEEHTSELQSRLHLVCRLLLEKKKKNIQK